MTDYGEPWEMDGTDIADNAGKMVCESFLCERDQRRAVACVNACRGIEDPEKVVPLLLKAIKAIDNFDKHRCSLGSCDNWSEQYKSLEDEKRWSVSEAIAAL